MNALAYVEQLAATAADHRRIADFMRGENAKLFAAVIDNGGTVEQAHASRVFQATASRIVANDDVAEYCESRATEFWRAAAAEMVRGGAVQIGHTPTCVCVVCEDLRAIVDLKLGPPNTAVKISIPGATVECADEAALRRLAAFLASFARPDVTQHGFGCECDACDKAYHAHIEESAKACRCCPWCQGAPCAPTMAGGICDDMLCTCDGSEDYEEGEEELDDEPEADAPEPAPLKAGDPVTVCFAGMWLRGHVSDEEARRVFVSAGLAK